MRPGPPERPYGIRDLPMPWRPAKTLAGGDPVPLWGHRVRRRFLRDLDVERGAGAPVGLDPDAAVDAADELAADIEAEPRAADAAAHVRIEAVELLEDPPLLALRDAETGVRDREADMAAVRLERDVDRAAT